MGFCFFNYYNCFYHYFLSFEEGYEVTQVWLGGYRTTRSSPWLFFDHDILTRWQFLASVSKSLESFTATLQFTLLPTTFVTVDALDVSPFTVLTYEYVVLKRHLAGMMFFQFKASNNYLSIYRYYQKRIVDKTRKWHIKLCKRNTDMNTMGLPKEAVDSIRLWMDPAQAAGTGVRAALVVGQSARATQQTVTEQLWTGTLLTSLTGSAKPQRMKTKKRFEECLEAPDHRVSSKTILNN